ncbi:MAG: 3-oxoacyl-[acyl-carrier-protein] synthase III C-terminal domain-containing protein [Ferruginibacter sp.]
MFDIKIAHIGYYVPENRLQITDLINMVNDRDIPAVFPNKEAYAAFIKEELKVDAVRVEDKLDDKEMLTNTVEQIFMDEAAEPAEIDLIILAQEGDQRQTLNLGQYIQYEFELDNAYVLNLDGNHCANIDHAFTLASQIANKNERINNILILGNIKIDNLVNRLVGTYGVLSDVSGAMLLKKTGKGPALINSRAVSAGRFHAVNLNRDDSLILCKYYVKTLRELLERSNVTPDEVAHIITQNANPLLINQCLQMVGLDVEKIFSANQTKYAHLDCLDFLVNLKDLMKEMETTKKEGLILSFGTGWAGSFISSFLSYEH